MLMGCISVVYSGGEISRICRDVRTSVVRGKHYCVIRPTGERSILHRHKNALIGQSSDSDSAHRGSVATSPDSFRAKAMRNVARSVVLRLFAPGILDTQI